ncbi:MAG: zinc ribbon domain-containing protein [Eubacteriales bacterium]|nr:zinc ribbon domain-containing protein [Eubacteriales bacterium]
MSKFCKNCGTQLNDDIKFCGSCGTNTQAGVASPLITPPSVSVNKTPMEANPRPSSGKPPKKLLLSAVAVIVVIALVAFIIPRLGQTVTNTDGMTGDLSSFAYSEQDYAAKAQTRTVSPESPTASAHGVTIQFGEYALDGDKTLMIRELPEKTDQDNGVKVTAYDFALDDQANFDDVITIAIPYDAKYAESGVENECIGAKYFNQDTGEWEGVYYEVDTENGQVLIYTTHLSTYGVFQVKDENTRKAYITDTYAIAGLLNSGKSFEVIQELAEQGQPGNAAFEAGFSAVNSVTGNSGTALTALTLGGQYEGALADALGKGTQRLGLALAAVQTCYDFTYNFSDDQSKLSTLANLVKNVANNAVGYFGSATLQVGFAAIAVFDVVLSEVQSDMMELKLENLGGVYQYYNDVEAMRSTQEWRKILIEILKENADDPQMAQQLINQEIDSYCDRFWTLDYGKVKEIAGVSGLNYSFDERQWTKDRAVLTAQYREHLLSRLQAPMTSARNYLLSQAMEQAQREFEKQLRALKEELNKTIQVQIIEQPEGDADYQYEGYTVRFAPLSSRANTKNWSGKMPAGGEMDTSFTIIGHMQSGSPGSVELYKPGEDTPTLTIPFKVAYPTTTILLSSHGENEPKLEQPDVTAAESQQPEDKAYAWVLVETIHETRQADVDNTNKGGIYQKSASASPGSYTFSWKYIGESDDYPDPDVIHGESFATQLSISVPPAQIKGGETINLSFDLAFTEQNLSYYDGHGSCRADWGNVKFTNTAGKSFFEIYSSVKYSDKNVSSISDTISAEIPAGYSEGDREELWVGDYAGTYYVFEWQQIGSAAN